MTSGRGGGPLLATRNDGSAPQEGHGFRELMSLEWFDILVRIRNQNLACARLWGSRLGFLNHFCRSSSPGMNKILLTSLARQECAG